MIQGLIGRKLGMTQIFDEAGVVHPVTVIQCGPNVVTQIKTTETDGYNAVQLGFGVDKRLNRPEQGHLKKSGYLLRTLREVKADDVAEYEVGRALNVDVFNVGELVDVTGTSKGRGFQGGMKRHGFSGAQKTHGQSDRWRAPGSIGSSATPGRVFKGKRMAGQTGFDRVTVQNLKVLRVDLDRNVILVEGSVPGPTNGIVIVKRAVKVKAKK